MVFTNRVFDLLHPGHLRYLRDARALGDALIIAIIRIRRRAQTKGRAGPSTRGRARGSPAGAGCGGCRHDFRRGDPARGHHRRPAGCAGQGRRLGADNIVGRDVVEARGGRVVRMELARGSPLPRCSRGSARCADPVWDNRRLCAHLRPRPGGLSALPLMATATSLTLRALLSQAAARAALDKLAPVTAGLTPAAKALAAVAARAGPRR